MKTKKLVYAALVGAMYTVLTLFPALEPFSFAPVQCRVSEALTLLPFLFPEAMWGLFAGCLLSNIVGGYGLLDIVFGSLATLLAGFLTSKCKNRYVALLPPVLINGLVVGLMLSYVLTPETMWISFPVFAGQVALGEMIACAALGLPLLFALERTIFKNDAKLV